MSISDHIRYKQKLKMISDINPYCHRICYFAVPMDYDKKGKNIEQIYRDSLVAEFNRKETARFVIRNNLRIERKHDQQDSSNNSQ